MDERDFLHDIANPLGAALFWTELLKEQRLPDSQAAIHKVHALLMDIKKILEDRRTEIVHAQKDDAA